LELDEKGLDPNTATGTKDAIDPETGALGTGGTPLTTGYGVSGSTIGTGTAAGQREFERGDFTGETPAAKDYTAGVHGEESADDQVRNEDSPGESR
jgi:hypothetical protein